jgi:hypothetical protein
MIARASRVTRVTALSMLLFCALAARSSAAEPWADRAAGNGFFRVMSVVGPSGNSDLAVAQTSISWYTNPATGVEVVFVASSHAGTASYYRTLGHHLDRADLVLYEGLLHGAPLDALHPDLRWLVRSLDARHRLEGLETQDALERPSDPRWVDCDLPLSETNAFWDGVTQRGRRSMFSDEFKQRVLRWERQASAPRSTSEAERLARSLRRDTLGAAVRWGSVALGQEGSPFRALQDRRDRHIFGTLRRHLDEGRHRRIAMLYGAAHMVTYEPWLRSLGFTLNARTWVDAFGAD